MAFLRANTSGGGGGNASVLYGPLASRPAAGTAHTLYIASDANGLVYYDNGTTWTAVTGSAIHLNTDTDTGLTANSDANVATQKAAKAYVDLAIANNAPPAVAILSRQLFK